MGRQFAVAAWRCAAATLDLTIAGCALALLIVLVTGGVDLGWLSITRASRPFLVLCLLVPIRVTRPTLASLAGFILRWALAALAVPDDRPVGRPASSSRCEGCPLQPRAKRALGKKGQSSSQFPDHNLRTVRCTRAIPSRFPTALLTAHPWLDCPRDLSSQAVGVHHSKHRSSRENVAS
jgi:hypothetical protein